MKTLLVLLALSITGCAYHSTGTTVRITCNVSLVPPITP